jgi:hypothetical protein
MMRRPLVRWFGALALAGALACAPAAAEELPDRDAAVAAATQEAVNWLDALDARRYAEGWDEAAAVMKEGRSQEEWIRDIGGPRELFGKRLIRELQRAEYSTTVRGAPIGNYVTVTYLTQFAKAPPALETILLTLEDNRWRIAGYSIGRTPEASLPAPAPEKSSAAPGPKG